MVKLIPSLCILITFHTALSARPSSDGQQLAHCIFHHGMHPKHSIPRSKGAGVCMSIVENVGSAYIVLKLLQYFKALHEFILVY